MKALVLSVIRTLILSHALHFSSFEYPIMDVLPAGVRLAFCQRKCSNDECLDIELIFSPLDSLDFNVVNLGFFQFLLLQNIPKTIEDLIKCKQDEFAVIEKEWFPFVSALHGTCHAFRWRKQVRASPYRGTKT